MAVGRKPRSPPHPWSAITKIPEPGRDFLRIVLLEEWNEIVFFGFESLRRWLMKHEPIDEQPTREALPTETERNYGLLTAGAIALIVVGTAIYWIS